MKVILKQDVAKVGKKGELGGGKTGLLYFGDWLDINILQPVAV